MSGSTPYDRYKSILSAWASAENFHKDKTAEEIDVMLGASLSIFSELYVSQCYAYVLLLFVVVVYCFIGALVRIIWLANVAVRALYLTFVYVCTHKLCSKTITNTVFWIIGAVYNLHYKRYVEQHDDKRHKQVAAKVVDNL